jgi:hypothetical protein
MEAPSTSRLDHFRARMAPLAMERPFAATLLAVYSGNAGRGPNDAVHHCEDRDRDYNKPKGRAIE